jgi:hypothetical protein
VTPALGELLTVHRAGCDLIEQLELPGFEFTASILDGSVLRERNTSAKGHSGNADSKRNNEPNTTKRKQ